MTALGGSCSEGWGRTRAHQAEGAPAEDGGISEEKPGYGWQNSANRLLQDPEGMMYFLSVYLPASGLFSFSFFFSSWKAP